MNIIAATEIVLFKMKIDRRAGVFRSCKKTGNIAEHFNPM